MTELGEIPSEWEVKKLKELLDVLKDGTHNPPKRTEEGIPLLSAENIFNGKINYGINEKCISEEDYELMHKNYSIEKDDILMTIVGTIGRVAVVKDNKKFAVQRSVAILRSNKKVNNLFLTQFLSSTICKKELDRKSNSTAQAGLYLGELGKINIIVPSIKEQEKIASILSTVDEQIDNVDSLIEKNKELKKGLMQKLLSQGIGHTAFKKTEIGEIPEEWEVKRVGDITEIKTGGTPSTKCEEYWKDGRIPWMVSGDVNKGIINSVDGRITESGMNNSAAKLLPKDTVMIALNGQGKTKGTVAYLNIEVTCNQSLAGFLPKEEKFYSKYLFYNLQNRYSEIRGLTGDGARNGLNLGILRDILIPLPGIEEQRRTASILSQIDEKIEEYENKKQKLEELKIGLMQKLLTGEIRVC